MKTSATKLLLFALCLLGSVICIAGVGIDRHIATRTFVENGTVLSTFTLEKAHVRTHSVDPGYAIQQTGHPNMVDLVTTKDVAVNSKITIIALVYDADTLYTFQLILISRAAPVVTQERLSVPLSRLFLDGISISTNLSKPATLIRNVSVLLSNPALQNVTVTAMGKDVKMKWELPSTDLQLDNPFTVNVIVEDNAEGLRFPDSTGMYNITALRNGVSSSNVTVFVEEPICQRPVISDNTAMSIKELQAIVNSASYLLGMAYECSQGYVLNGTALQVCIANETFRPPSPPSCAVVQCNVSSETECRGSTPPDPAVSFDYGTNVSLSCQPEFYLLKPGYLTCNANATSSTHCPVCQPIPCNTSSFPTPVNGQIVRGHHTVQVNKSLPITCHYGYTPSTTNASVQCLLGEIWQTTNITCEIISCGQPSNISNGSYNGTNFTYNSTVTYSCDDAYEIAGGQTTRTCGVNGDEGKWDGELLICKAIPCKLDELKTKISPDKFEIQQQTDTVAVGDNVPISCQRGYKLSSRTNVTCEIGSVWKSISASSRCDAITCNSGKIEIENGEVGLAHNTSVGSIRSLTCDSAFEKSPSAYQIMCNETGYWSTVVECRAKGALSNPINIALLVIFLIVALFAGVLASILTHRSVIKRNSRQSHLVSYKSMPQLNVVQQGCTETSIDNNTSDGGRDDGRHNTTITGKLSSAGEDVVQMNPSADG
ncbi:sushi, von Willebrand factor type A, EGF and pentraxin domain-containing protein 1-like [Sycon ciliatum]|uniref:sushi, von Willebrand factor type A, EGF and pentraxin domain-containing protein 1-like n=1 Tax=Sycon ciliatum TaxID=27933 RepID=UPI0031F66AA1